MMINAMSPIVREFPSSHRLQRASLSADDRPGFGQFIFDIVGAQIEHMQFILDGVPRRFGGAFDLFTGRASGRFSLLG